MDREDTRHFKTLEVKHKHIKYFEKTSRDYIEALMSIDDGFRSISQYF